MRLAAVCQISGLSQQFSGDANGAAGRSVALWRDRALAHCVPRSTRGRLGCRRGAKLASSSSGFDQHHNSPLDVSTATIERAPTSACAATRYGSSVEPKLIHGQLRSWSSLLPTGRRRRKCRSQTNSACLDGLLTSGASSNGRASLRMRRSQRPGSNRPRPDGRQASADATTTPELRSAGVATDLRAASWDG
eukprot:4119106-Prymnesium_polylepis.4